MKYKISKVLFVALTLSMFTNCSDEFLETAPTDAVSPANALSTPANMLVALNGIHRAMYAQSPLSGYSYAGEGYIMPWLDFPGDDILHSTSGNGWFKSAIQWLAHTTADRTDLKWVWAHYYHIIGNANAIINAAEGMTEDENLANVLGQAKTYRTFAHFRLVNLFAKNYMIGTPATDLGVPIMLATEAPYEGQERATVQAVYDQIEKDLTEAIAHFEHASSRADISNISLEVAQGMAARVALFTGDWAMAASYAHDARQGYSLMGESEYKAGFNSAAGTEVMWGGRLVPDQTTYYRAWFYYIGCNFNGTQNRTNPKFINHKLYDLIPATDYRKDLFLETAPNTVDGFSSDTNYADEDAFWDAYDNVVDTYGMSSRFKTYPYMQVKFKNRNGATIESDDLTYIRVSEMYLIEAEALNRSGDDAGAAQVLFELVSARDNAYVLSANTGTALLDEIKIQRRIELWGEGHRLFDMERFDEALDRTGTGADESLYQAGFKQDKPSVNVNWVWQIPQAEIDTNPKISSEQQNPSTGL